MKLTPLGKFALLIIVLGVAIGGWRMWSKAKGKLPGLPPIPGFTKSTPQPGNPTVPAATAAPAPVDPGGAIELQIVSSASKKGWLNDQINGFNAAYSGRYFVRLMPVETREAMHGILGEKIQPALWSPSSVIWADRLAEVWQNKKGASIVDTSDENQYKLVLKSPMVFLTTRDRAKVLRPILGAPGGWAALRNLSSGKRKVPWGRFRWAHADPLNANSGMLTMAMILSDFADRLGQSGSVERVARSGAFRDLLQDLKRGFVYNKAVEQGSSALVKSFVAHPESYDVITAYESAALAEVIKDPSLEVIYPNPTVDSESAVAVLNAPWVTPEQQAGAREFLKFVSQPAAARDGVKEHWRPESGASLSGEISRYAGNGFKTRYPSIELPPYAALNDAAVVWRGLFKGQ